MRNVGCLVTFVTFILTQFVNAKVTINKFEDCTTNANYPIDIRLQIKTQDDKQIVEEGSLKSTVPLGNNILDVVDVYISQNGEYVHFITVKEPLCEAMNKYLGDFMHGIQEAVGLKAGSCPVAPGDYKIINHVIDYDKFKYKDVPVGNLKVIVKFLDKETNETLNCHITELSITSDK